MHSLFNVFGGWLEGPNRHEQNVRAKPSVFTMVCEAHLSWDKFASRLSSLKHIKTLCFGHTFSPKRSFYYVLTTCFTNSHSRTHTTLAIRSHGSHYSKASVNQRRSASRTPLGIRHRRPAESRHVRVCEITPPTDLTPIRHWMRKPPHPRRRPARHRPHPQVTLSPPRPRL